MEKKIFVQAERLLLGDKVMNGYIEKIRDLFKKGSRHLYLMTTDDFNADALEEIRAVFDKYYVRYDVIVYSTPEDAVCRI